MTARPLSTFQSEGWHRPSRARADHYFRPSAVMALRMSSPGALQSLCGKYGSGGAIRPWLKHTPKGRCQECNRHLLAVFNGPHDGPWFGMENPK